LLTVSSWLLALGWFWQLAEWLVRFPQIPDLTRRSFAALPPSQNPQLTVIVPACNEEASIETTLRSLLSSMGIRLQIIAVDDRSTDQTGAIMDAVATAFEGGAHTIEVLHISELRAGWLGKPHALATASSKAQADWILFTDGDVVFAPNAAALAVRHAQDERLDHLVLMPDWTMGSHGEAAMHGAMHALSTWTLRLWRVSDPKARDFIGVGAFNLVRRDIYEALGGFTALRMEVLEDLRFGWMVKRAGYRQGVALGTGLAAVRWSAGAWGVVRNLEKNLFALYRYKTWLAGVAALGLMVQIALPFVAVFVGGWACVAGLLTFAAIAGLYFASGKVTRVTGGYVVFYPLAAALFLFALLRSTALALWRGGIVWRGTLYSLKELRANAGRFW